MNVQFVCVSAPSVRFCDAQQFVKTFLDFKDFGYSQDLFCRLFLGMSKAAHTALEDCKDEGMIYHAIFRAIKRKLATLAAAPIPTPAPTCPSRAQAVEWLRGA